MRPRGRVVLCFEAPPERAGHRRRLELDGRAHLLGRSPDCAVVVDDGRVSRRHARLSVEGDQVMIEDLGGPNGTVVNGVRIARQPLSAGDLLSLGQARIRVAEVDLDREAESASSTEPRPDSAPSLVKPLVDPPTLGPDGKGAFYRALGLEAAEGDRPEALLRKSRHYAVLHDISRWVAAAPGPEAMMEAVLDRVLTVCEGDRAYVALAPRRTEEHDLAAPSPPRDPDRPSPPPDPEEAETWPPGQPAAAVIRVRGSTPAEARPLSETVARHVLEGRCAVLSHDPQADARFVGAESLFLSRIRALMAVPIVRKDAVRGVLVVESEGDDRFGEAELDLLGVVASTVGQALENLELAERREATIRALREAQADLLATRTQLVRAEQLAVVGRLASGLAHEVNNHLAPFVLADVIARKYPEDREVQASVEMMLEARQHILDLVGEVKTFARPGAGDAARREPVELLALARSVARFMTCDAAVKRHRLEVVDEGDPLVMAVGGRLRQVLVNLVKNAADALGTERVGDIVIRVSEGEGEATVWVEDDGPGVQPELAERLFDPFVSTKGEQGLGLGLDIARRIARDHGGDLVLAQGRLPGACFRLSMPAI